MADPWLQFFARHADIVAKPKRKWTQTEAETVWVSLAQDGVARALYKIFFRRVRNREIAEELLDKCLAQLSVDRTYDPRGAGPGAFRKWVLACVHHHYCSYCDDRRKEAQYFGHRVDVPPERTDQWAAAHSIEASVDGMALLNHLPDREREVISRWLAGETSRESAAALGLTEGHVRQLIFRSIRNLRKKFGITVLESFSRFNQ